MTTTLDRSPRPRHGDKCRDNFPMGRPSVTLLRRYPDDVRGAHYAVRTWDLAEAPQSVLALPRTGNTDASVAGAARPFLPREARSYWTTLAVGEELTAAIAGGMTVGGWSTRA